MASVRILEIDVAPDATRVAILARPEAETQQMPRMNLLLNFFEEIRRLSH